jgi:predicted DsbA family dithiol-disulfide isomerase
VDIEIIYDTVCPWCYIGKRRLDQALALRPHLKLTTHWRPFLLNPELPPDGVDRTAYLVKKFGSETRVRRIYGAIGEAGLSVEIDFAFDRIQKTPNSIDSHRLVKYAARHGVADPLVEALFVAYFVHGLDIGDHGILQEIGVEHGLDRVDLERYLASNEDHEAVTQDNARAHRLGVNGVPSFVFTGPMVISGAQEPQILARMLDAAASAA